MKYGTTRPNNLTYLPALQQYATIKQQGKGLMEKYLTAKQVADKLQVNRTTLWRWEKNGTLKPLKIGGVKRYSQDQIDKNK
jgi:predicted DNA-binding transcriptional regulator AlpA